MATSVVNNISNILETVLADAVVAEVLGITGGWLVKAGPLQQDPTQYGVNIMVQTNDPDGEGKWVHERIDPWPQTVGLQDVILPRLPRGAQEMGGSQDGDYGGEAWWRRFVVELRIFLTYTEDTETERDRLANLVLAAAENALFSDVRMTQIAADTFGESVWNVTTPAAKSELTGGGLGGNYVGKIWVEIGTYRNKRWTS